MSSWVLPPGGRRPPPNPNGGSQTLRAFRRPAPYPVREERTEDHNKDGESYEELDQQHYSGQMNYEGYQQNAAPEAYKPPADRRKALYQRFYRQVQEARRAADCVVLSVSNQSTDYPKSLGQCLQERGLSVEMLYLQAESGLTRALQDVRGLGSPLCILVEQTNVALCSCTVIIFSESLKIHRNMPKEQALDFVMAEYRRGLGEHAQKDPAEMVARVWELVDELLEREKLERHAVPPETRQLLLFLAEGVHLYPDELGTLSEYLRSRQDHVQASSSEADRVRPERRKILPPGLGKPPPLLPTPSGPHAPQPTMGDPPQPTPLMAPPGSYPKTKPPPLLSMHRAIGPPHGPSPPHGSPAPRGPPPPRGPHGPSPRGPPHHHGPPSPRGPPTLRGPLLPSGPPHSLMAPRGPMSPRGPRGAPPSLKSLHMGGPQPGLLRCPGAPPSRPNTPRR